MSAHVIQGDVACEMATRQHKRKQSGHTADTQTRTYHLTGGTGSQGLMTVVEVNVGSVKMYVEPLIDLPCLKQPPTKSHCIATTQRHIQSEWEGGT